MNGSEVNTMTCWEFKNCEWIEDCSAYPDHGDCCMIKLGTLCCAHIDLIDKMLSCKKCSFFNSEHFNKEKAEAMIDELQ